MFDQSIFLLTDFGLTDPYVGQMKAVLTEKIPHCPLIDISHNLLPHNLYQAGFFLYATWPYLPSGSVCLVVVDPGVGTKRDILLLQAEGKFVLVPDNGLISLLLSYLNNQGFLILRLPQIYPQDSISSTFHGRDIFAPMAAKLVSGSFPWEETQPVSEENIVRLPFIEAQISNNTLKTRVIHIDRFGNCLLNLKVQSWSNFFSNTNYLSLIKPRKAQIQVVDTYANISEHEAGLLPGSQGFWELALNQASCADRFNLKIDDFCHFQI